MGESKKEREEWSRINLRKSIELLESLDPETFAITSNWHGICIYPRKWGPRRTNWERGLKDSGLRIPAEWTSYLSATSLNQVPLSVSRSGTSSKSSLSSQALMKWLREEEDGSSKSPGTTPAA